MPRLAGLPAYARPPRPVRSTPRFMDPDDLPLEAYRTAEDHTAYVAALDSTREPATEL